MSGTPNRRPSLAAISPAVSGRRLSSGITPNLATPSVDNAEQRRGSLRDLTNERDTHNAVLRQYERDLKSGKLAHCTYPSIRQRLTSTLTSSLPPTIEPNKTIITLDGATDPVTAFDQLIETGLEAIPVTTSQHHAHNIDGTITIFSSHQQYPTLYKQCKEILNKQESPSQPTTPQLSSTSIQSQPQIPTTPVSPKIPTNSFSTPAKSSGIHDQCIIIDPTTNTATLSTTTSTSSGSLPSMLSLSTPAKDGIVSPAPPSPRGTNNTNDTPQPSRSLRESLNLNQTSTVAGCGLDCIYRQTAGWLDIRDLASCIVYVYQQPINEDLLEFREGGHVEPQPFVINTRGLDGITDLPGLTHSASYSSLNSESSQSSTNNDGTVASTPSSTTPSPSTSSSTLHPTLNFDTSPQPTDSMGIVYEDDEAKVQGLKIKEQSQQDQHQNVGRFQGFSHRLSLAPMAEEDDTFDLDSIQKSLPNNNDEVSSNSSTPSNKTNEDNLSSSGTSTSASRSRSQSRHRRKMVTADELSTDLTEGGQQAWLSTLKTGLGKFASVGNISTAYLSRRHQLRTVKPSSTLYEIFKLFTVNHAHRIAVVDEKTNKMIDIISHRTIIKWLWENRMEFFQLTSDNQEVADNTITDGDETSEIEVSTPKARSLLDKRLNDLTLGTTNLTQIRDDILGLDALQEMDEHSRTGLAVVDNCGRLVGATSSRTIKRITHARDHKTMSQPLIGFIEQSDEELQPDNSDPDERCMVSHSAVVVLDDEDVKFSDILSAMYKHNTHRIFLVTEESYPTRVISLSDILQLLLY